MRAFNKITFLGLVFVFLISTCSTLPFSGTSASFSDTKYTNAEITAGAWDTPASWIGLSDLNLTTNSEKLNESANISRGDKDSISTYESLLVENSSDNVSSSLNNVSSAENLTSNSSITENSSIAEKQTIKPTEAGRNSIDSSMGDKDSISTYESLLDENSSDNVSSSLNNVSSAENLTSNSSIAEKKIIKPTEAGRNSIDSSMGSSSGPTSMGSSSGPTTTSEKHERDFPVTNISSNVTEGYAPLTVQFTDLSKNVIERNWAFGDGDTSTEKNPVHTYSIAGNYNVNLTVSNENGNSSKLATITVHEQPDEVIPVANFSSDITEGVAPLTVQFTDLSKNVIERNWAFGDGDTSTEKNPVHTYSTAGTYEVSLIANNENGKSSKLATITVYEQLDGIVPVANFSNNFTEGYAPLTVQFIDLSENVTQWKWDFGDKGTSTEKNPVHTYSVAGNYNVNLTVSNENGNSSKLATISVLQPILPVANFSSDITEGFAPLTVQFTGNSENATGWNWDFGDEGTSTEKNPVHIFSAAGNYNVNLTASNENGTNSKLAIISVLQPVVVPVANFTSNVTEGYAPLTVAFTDLSENVTEWKWDFGDGDTSTDQEPVHIYSAAGSYNVSLIANNEDGTSTKTSKITVNENPKVT
ncbi:MAG: PKD domain-containing protein [Methanosarcina sp.]|nr:PKD domain-containing protein [Methanosarcina sp.]